MAFSSSASFWVYAFTFASRYNKAASRFPGAPRLALRSLTALSLHSSSHPHLLLLLPHNLLRGAVRGTGGCFGEAPTLPPPRLPAPAYIGARLFVLSLCRDQKATDRPQGAAAGVAIVTLKRLGSVGGGRSPALGGRREGKASEGLLLRPRREVGGSPVAFAFCTGVPRLLAFGGK